MRTRWKAKDRTVRERKRSAPSLHGLLIPNFTDNGRGASFFFFFTPIHLLNVERALGLEGQSGVDFARPPGPNAHFFFPSLPLFSLPFSSFALHVAGRIWFLSHIRVGKPSTTAEGLILWRVWGKADINVAGARIEPRDKGEPQPVKNTLDLSSCRPVQWCIRTAL